jgi:hypothetical protein
MERDDIERLARVEQKLDDIIHTLQDNGQPGFVTTTNTRLNSLESTATVIKTAVGSIGAIIAWVVPAFISHLFGWKGHN